MSKSIFSPRFLTYYLFVFLVMIYSSLFALEVEGPLPPPVEISFMAEGILQLNTETTIKLRVTPLEDMHAKICCFLPEGIELVRENGILVRPNTDVKTVASDKEIKYSEIIDFWVGPVKGGVTKEFSFRVIFHNKQKYKFVASVEALAKWGEKEELSEIDI